MLADRPTTGMNGPVARVRPRGWPDGGASVASFQPVMAGSVRLRQLPTLPVASDAALVALDAVFLALVAVAFALYATQMEDVMAVADAGGIMPPKSTWFEPKLADGMVSHVLD